MLSQSARLDLIMKFEGGEITQREFYSLFSDLIKSGMCWSLQGFYGRTAQSLIDGEVIDTQGNILIEPTDEPLYNEGD